MVQRLTYRKRHSYATKSNQTRVVKTPGKYPILASLICFRRRWEACLSVHEQEGEWAKMPCDWQEDSRSILSRNLRTVNRAYGGVLSGSAVRERLAIKCS
ncbi:hypothetical protein BHE74_00019572 [Ensete ventricosum]|nr:hypothetical protein BHE74_00019572 [Ensete ventricosum]